MEGPEKRLLIEAQARLRLDIQSSRNDGWTDALLRARLERLEQATAEHAGTTVTIAA